MKRIAAIVLLLLARGAPGAAQNPIGYGVPLAAERFGRVVIEAYVGTLGWTHTSGDSHYTASATLRDGRVHCSVTARSPEGTFSTTGAGLIDISLGLDPDPPDPDAETPPAQPARPGGKMYIVRAACPHPRSSTPTEARWSDEYNTYKQPGGDYDMTRTAAGIILHKLPEQLKGHWEATSEEETRTMTWGLCLKTWACPGIN